jgi:predicted metal-dependent hydrolase
MAAQCAAGKSRLDCGQTGELAKQKNTGTKVGRWLRIVSGLVRGKPELSENELVIPVYDTTNQIVIVKKVLQWYKREADQVFKECIEHFAPLMNVAPTEIKLTSAKTQWGSCTAQGVIRLNWQLVTMPLHLIDYVVVHELAHLQEMNHSAAFWKVVEGACPGYVQVRKELREWSPGMPEI